MSFTKSLAAVIAAASVSLSIAHAQAPAGDAQAPAPAETKPALTAEPYSRSSDAQDGTILLEIASRRFRAPAKDGAPRTPDVILVGAVHVGEPAYYSALQAFLDSQSLVLFEGVRPPGAGSVPADADDSTRDALTRGRLEFLKSAAERELAEGKAPSTFDEFVENAGKRWRSVLEGSRTDAWGNPITIVRTPGEAGTTLKLEFVSMGIDGKPDTADDIRVACEPIDPKKADKAKAGLQTKLATALGLSFQLEQIDSSKANWQSSDMSIDELEKRFKETGADGGMLLSMLDGSSLLSAVAGYLLDYIGKSKEMQAMAKFMLIETLGASDLSGGKMPRGAAGMDKLMKVILEDRNAVVIRDLKETIAAKPSLESIAIFYGAGHMSDLERRLREDLGYEPVETTWLTAMRVHPKEAKMTKAQAKSMRATVRQMFKGS